MASDAEPILSDAQKIILLYAESTRAAVAGKPYTWGGSTTAGFDCSGFVIYVFNEAYGSNTLPRVTADALRTNGRFKAVTGAEAPGDLVFFSAAAGGKTASHVGIVVSAEEWIGCQSSTGVAYVKTSNAYWKKRHLAFGRYAPIKAWDGIIPYRAGSYASTIC